MTGLWIAVALGITLSAGLLMRLRRARARSRRPAKAQIVELASSTSFDRDSGAVRSVQKADLLLERSALEGIWTPAYLERLARTYWRFLSHVTLGLVRVRYTESERSVVLVARALKLLSFYAPEYEMSPTRGLVRWRIARGLLVSRQGHDGRGYLQIEVCRYLGAEPSLTRLHVEVAVANFYPSIASGLSLRLYNATQSRVHVIVTYGFLRSLARLDLAESRVGRYRGEERASGGD
jgi:hypothetical protein